MNSYHVAALLHQTIEGLHVEPKGVYVDATFGGGGHSRALLEQLDSAGRLYSFDKDITALRNKIDDSRWTFVNGDFRYISNYLDYYGISPIDGLVADLGVSSYDFDTAQRGFSFRYAGTLDMRMNPSSTLTAREVLNGYNDEELIRVLRDYGEVLEVKNIVRGIRRYGTIERIEELVGVISGTRDVKVLPDGTEIDINPRIRKTLTQVFQALRIEVNDELGALKRLLTSLSDNVKIGGYVAILSYHSLEDRLVKNYLNTGTLDGVLQKDFYGNVIRPFIPEKVIVPTQEEIEHNPRVRSAKLRIGRRYQNLN